MIDKRFPHSYSSNLAELRRRLQEPAPAKIQMLTGPRQVGKTHLLHRLGEDQPDRVIYAAADAPAATLPGWWEARWRQAEQLVDERGAAILLVDEIQYLPDWSRRLKAEQDRVVREGKPIHVVVTGSSNLRIGRGAKETMAGRFERLQLLHWSPAELARQFSLDPYEAVESALRYGAYPGAQVFVDQPGRWRNYVNDAIVEPAIGRDLMATEVVRKPALLRQVFALAAEHPAEIISLQKLRGQLVDAGALETIAHYFELLREAFLIAPVPKYSAREIRRRASPPKLVTLNQGILGACLAVDPRIVERDRSLWGRWVENACIAHAWNAGQRVGYWRAEPLEVDLVSSGSWGAWAIEVKTGSYGTKDLAGLLEFCRRNTEFRPLLLHGGAARDERTEEATGVTCQPWRQFLLSGPPGL